jgi:FkbH-like protein
MTEPLPPPQAWELADLPLHRLISEGRRVTKTEDFGVLRIAVLGDAATQHYCQALGAVLKLRGWWPELFEAEFDTISQEVLDPASALYRNRPEFVVLFMTAQPLWHRFSASADKASFADITLARIVELWAHLKTHSTATIVQHNFVVPLNRSHGNHTPALSETFVGTVLQLNALLLDAASAQGVIMVDTEFQASYHGKRRWLDERLWCQARQGLSPSFLPSLAKNVSDVVLAERGVGIKCVVVDLDNTIWGGILAEDGRDLIEIGQTEVGLAFYRFQLALLELKSRGILLAICSKNNQRDVLDMLDNHPDMILRRDDFAAIVANFDDKVSNILAIRDKLNLALESFVFLDDTAFERALVRRGLPQIQVPEMSEDPADFVADLARWNLFEGRSATAEDLARLSYYRSEDARQEIRAKFGGLDEFVADLGMTAEIRTFDGFTLPRVLQLVQRSNQFNLTTIRHGEADLRRFSDDPHSSTFTVRLADRLGDNGIIAAVILRRDGRDAIVDTWIMSCRVLGRRVEDLTVQLIVERAKGLGCTRVIGRYTPTQKNALVENLYLQHGFVDAGVDGTTRLYRMDIQHYSPQTIPIAIREATSAATP